MSIEKVSWEYKNGLKSFLNLFNMIETALNSLQKEGFFHKINSKITKNYGSFYLDHDDFWICIHFDDPENIFFGYMEHFTKNIKNNEIFKDMIKLPGHDIPAQVYDFNENHFFELPKDDQKKEIFNFLKECFEVIKNLN
jgi:hypothetical protein